jgi:hypothetical protein
MAMWSAVHVRSEVDEDVAGVAMQLAFMTSSLKKVNSFFLLGDLDPLKHARATHDVRTS